LLSHGTMPRVPMHKAPPSNAKARLRQVFARTALVRGLQLAC
jgi:hypothetical protein